MNNIDYNLEIKGEKKTYKPRKEFIDPIKNSKNKIFEITADNSYGKSFILNLLAYGLEADKLDDDRILKSIKEAVARYDDKNSYNLDYHIVLDLPDKKELVLSKEKNGDKIIQIDNSAPIGHKVLHKDLTVIYDVPINPSERLNAVIKDLGTWNENLRTKFENVARYFFDVSKEFDSVRDEDKIKDLKTKSGKIGKEIFDNGEKVELQKNMFKDLKAVKNLDKLSFLLKRKLEIETKLVIKGKEFRLLKKPSKVEKKDELKIKELNKELTSINYDFKSIISKLIAFINNDNEILELITDVSRKSKYNRIKEAELSVIFSDDNYVTIQKKLIDSISLIKDDILSFINAKKEDKSYVIHNTYSQLIELLEELMENKIEYLLNNAASVDSKKLKTQLQELVKQYKVKNFDSLKVFLNQDLKPLNGLMAQYVRTHNKLIIENKKKLVEASDDKYYKAFTELNDLKRVNKEVQNDIDLTCAECAKSLNITDLSRLDSIPKIVDLKFIVKKGISEPTLLENINESLSDLEKEIKYLELKSNDLVIDKRITDKAYELENNKNRSKYSEEQKIKINKIIQMFNRINANLKKYKELISKIESGNLSAFRAGEDIRFMELAGKIIAFSMDNKLLREEGQFIGLKFYDMMKQEFHCEDDIIIKKADVSTGLASANYLKQRIENVDGKYVVVLLDEIGNMAQNALNTVIESIKKLENQNRLVLALFTRPNNEGIKILEY